MAPLDKVQDGKVGRDPQDQRELDGRDHGRDKFLDNFPPVHNIQPQLPLHNFPREALPLYKLRLHRTLQHRARSWPQVWIQLVSTPEERGGRGGLVETFLRGGFKTILGD